ncbi:Alkaline phosphatase synthesis sensor protein PhoR [Marinibacterium anthonyi]|nr:Alkaline phosphatase synthesis sensor protein PhoR [Marinibacterium anthonyi]
MSTADLIADVLAAVPLPGLIIDQSERIIAANGEALNLLGQQIVGRHFATILRQPQVLQLVEESLRDRRPRHARHMTNDGVQDTLYEVSCRYVSGIGAVNAGALLICFQDVTHLEQAERMRRDFVANVSHELRTPLTAIMGFIETLRGPARDDEAVRDRFLEIMEGEAARMNRLVGDLLSLSRVEDEERIRPRETVNLTGILEATLRSVKPLAEEAGMELTLEAPEDPVTVTGDADQLQQVFTNLIGNAITYAPAGKSVHLVLSTTERDPAVRGSAARVQVIDKGPGIDPVHLPRLTERFYRADSHRSRELGGTGLGLAIVKHIINRHRGRLRVESELGKGSTFTVILPR